MCVYAHNYIYMCISVCVCEIYMYACVCEIYIYTYKCVCDIMIYIYTIIYHLAQRGHSG